jgi:hypothetical protein
MIALPLHRRHRGGTVPAQAGRGAIAALAVAAIAVLALLAVTAGLLPVEAAAPRPLTNEDIVRLVMHGTPEKTILHEIETRPVEFDLAPGVVEELARVGVSPTLIEAMRRRQAELSGPAGAPGPGAADSPPGAPRPPGSVAVEGGEPAAAPAPAPAGRLSLVFESAALAKETPAGKDGEAGKEPPPGKDAATGKAPATGKESAGGKEKALGPVMAITSLPKGAPRPEASEIGTVTDLALAILCTSGDHVPDHWDTRTPLKDGPRHELLLFRAGSKPERHKGFDVIVLGQEPAGPIPLAAGTHTLVVALAGQQTGSGAWRLLAYDTIRVEAKADAETRLVLSAGVRLSGSRMLGFKSDQVWKVRLETPPAEAP